MSEGNYYTLGRNPKQIIRDGSFATKKQFIQNELFHHHIVEHNMTIQGLLKKLHAFLIHQKIPDFYGYFLMGQIGLCSQDRIADCIIRQIEQLKNKQSHYHYIIKAINFREICLKSIAICIESLFTEVKPPLIYKLTEQIKHLRKLTIWVIQPIKKWKEYLLSISPNVFQDQHISFFYQNQDYLLKILKDADFISKSFLSEKVTFSHKQDPFLMRPYTEDQSNNNQFVNIFKFTNDEQKQYIECLEYLADERADYLKRKIIAKADKIKQIERVYQSNQLNQKIFVTKANPLNFAKAKNLINEAPIDFIEDRNKQKIKISIRTSSSNERRENKNKQMNIKGQKMKKIKQMELGSSTPIINFKKFNSVNNSNSNTLPINRSISMGIFKRMSSRLQKSQKQKDIQTDFESLLRKKQLEVLQNDNIIKKRSLSSIRLKDRLSQRKAVDSKQGADELRKILDQIEHTAPKIQDNYFIRKDSPIKTGKTLIQQNEQIMATLRQNILKQISDDTALRQKIQIKKIQQNKYLDKIIKMKLDQQTLKDIQKTKNKWIEGKDVLAVDINKKQLFGFNDISSKKTQKLTQLQQQLKRQMQLKFLRQVHQQISHKQAINKHQIQKRKQQKLRQKQLQIVLRKQQQQKRFLQIQKQQRNKIILQQMALQQKRKKQIQIQMQQVIQRQQQKLIKFSHQQKQKLQSQLRQNMKQKLLVSLRKQKSVMMQQKQAQEKKKLLQEQHRAQVRKKMEEQFQIQKNLERQRQREQKVRKLRMVAQKMDYLQNQVQSKLIKEQSQKQQKLQEIKQSINQFPNPRSKGHQQNKKRLRQQFELQLFAFNRPQNIQIQQDNFIIKDFRSQIDNDQHLNSKTAKPNEEMIEDKKSILDIEILKPKQSSLKASKLSSSKITSNFVRFSDQQNDQKPIKKQQQIKEQDIKKLGLDMTPQQYMIYKKKKQIINMKRVVPPLISKQQQILKAKKILDDFQKMSNIDSQKPQSIKKSQQMSQFIEKIQVNQLQKSNVQPTQNLQKKSPKKHKKNDNSSELSDVMKLTVHSKMGNIQKKRFVTSDQDDDSQYHKKKRNIKNKKKEQKNKIVSSEQQQIQKKFEKKPQKIQQAHLKIIQYEQLNDYLTNHFKKLSKMMRRLNLLKKDQLLNSFNDYKSIIIVQILNQAQVQGIIIATQNENKKNIRSLNIIHFGSYLPENTIKVIVKGRDLLFSKDPCSQITFSMYYNKQIEEQSNFIKIFQKQFDPYGAIFQKKISNQQTQRKHILRRMIAQQSVPMAKIVTIGQFKIDQNIIAYPAENSLGVDLGLQKTGKQLGGWTILSLFLSNYGKQEQIVKQLTSDVSQQSKNIKHLSKMIMKIKNNRFPDIQYQNYETPFQLNLRLIQLNKQLIKCDPKIQQSKIPLVLMKSSSILNPILNFQSASAKYTYQKVDKIGKFLRFKCKGSKILKLKSSLYSSVVTILPCKPANYKILIMNSLQFDQISNKISLDLYLKLFLANIIQHSPSTDQNIWLPQTSTKKLKCLEYIQQFGFKNEMRSHMQLSYTQYIPNCISYQPSHRDLFITPPFIVAVLNSDIEKCVQGSPIYIERIDINDTIGVSDMPIPDLESDF